MHTIHGYGKVCPLFPSTFLFFSEVFCTQLWEPASLQWRDTVIWQELITFIVEVCLAVVLAFIAATSFVLGFSKT